MAQNLYLDRDRDIKPFLGIGKLNTSSNDILDLLNTTMCMRLDNLLNVSTLARHTVTGELFTGGKYIITCKDFPVLSVTSILQGSLQIPYTQPDAYQIKFNQVWVEMPMSDGEGYERNRITYEAGYVTQAQSAKVGGTYVGQAVTFPDDLKLALLMMVSAVFNRRKNYGISQYNMHRVQVIFEEPGMEADYRRIINAYRKPFIQSV